MTGDVVQPDALAQIVKKLGCLHFCVSSQLSASWGADGRGSWPSMVIGKLVSQVIGEKIRHTLHRDIRWRIGRESRRIERKLSLPRVGEWIIDQEVGSGYQMRFVRVFDSEALQSRQVIAVAKLARECLLDRPELVAASGTEFTLDVRLEVGLNTAVIQQRVIDIHEETNRGSLLHGTASTVSICLLSAKP